MPYTLNLPLEPFPIDMETASIYYVGNATMLILYRGITILTDPNFLNRGQRAHLGYGFTTRRKLQPSITFDQLPRIDLVLLSHMHGDHFDHITQERLSKFVPIVTTPHAAAILKRKKFQKVFALETWDTIQVRKGDAHLRIAAMPALHAEGVFSSLLPPVMGSLIDFEDEAQNPLYRMYISGDTVLYDGLREIPERYSNINMAVLHLGHTRIFGKTLTMDEDQGLELMRWLHPQVVVPIHFGDYTMFKSPLDNFKQAVRAAGMERKVHYVRHGDLFTFYVERERV